MIARFFYLLSLSLWAGSVSFFSFGVAPSLFGTLPSPQAGEAIAAIFPIYYGFGFVSGMSALVSALFVWGGSSERIWRIVHTILVVLMLAATLFAGLVIRPQVTELRAQIHAPDAPPAAQQEFDRLHRLSVQLNGGVLVGALILLAATARKLAPVGR